MVAGEPLRRVGAPTPRLLRSPPLAKVQSHSHHLLRQVLFAYLAVPPILEDLVVIAVLHHSLLHCVVYNPCHPIPRLGVGKVYWSSTESYSEAGADGRGDLAGGEEGEGERGGARSVNQPRVNILRVQYVQYQIFSVQDHNTVPYYSSTTRTPRQSRARQKQ